MDSPVTETDILGPSDSRLFVRYGVRVLTRLLQQACRHQGGYRFGTTVTLALPSGASKDPLGHGTRSPPGRLPAAAHAGGADDHLRGGGTG